MTGPKPTVVNGRISIEYTNTSLGSHHLNLDVRINSPLLGGANALDVFGGGTIQWHDAVDRFVLKAKPMFDASMTFAIATIYEYVAGAYQPLATYSLGVAGTGSGGASPATEETYVFRDSAYNLDKVNFFEQGSSVPLHLNYGGLGTARKAFVDDILGNTSPEIGSWYRSKADREIDSFLAVTTTFNRRLRRKRGQA